MAELTGIKQPTLVRIERGSQSPGIETIAKILRALNGTLEVRPDGRILARLVEDEPVVPTQRAEQAVGIRRG